ncbi:MAG: Cna B-type domain-containing protein [Bulleidia sp.]
MNQINIGGKRKKRILRKLLAAVVLSLFLGELTAVSVLADGAGTDGTITVSSSPEEDPSETDRPDTSDSDGTESTVYSDEESGEDSGEETAAGGEPAEDAGSAADPAESADPETDTSENIQETDDLAGESAEDITEEPAEEEDTAEDISLEVNLTESSDSETGDSEHTQQDAVYLNGKSGDDSADGSSAENAVRTFARAKEIAQADLSISSIYITDSVGISGEISLDGTGAIVKRDASFSGYLFVINRGDSAVLRNITIDGNSSEATGTSKSLIYDCGSLTIEDGTVLRKNVLYDLGYFHATGGAIKADEGTIVMTGGRIEYNTANYGGGIYLYNHSEMTMSGGIIQNNNAVDGTDVGLYGYAAGGGIALYNGSILNFSGKAEIRNNHSDHMGGGISLGTGVASDGSDILNMTGGSVTGNSSGSGGGGIMVQAGKSSAYATANISGGIISGNSMTGTGEGEHAFGGGGIYVNGYSSDYPGFHNGVLNLTNALITENTAVLEGGGYAACPVSSTEMYLDNGAAIYGNTGSRADDVYILASMGYGLHSGNPFYTISSVMLGGTPYHWKDEQGNEVSLNHLKGQLNFFSTDYELVLSTDVRQDEAAQGLAAVIISGNTSATRGGGIGSNGTVNIGHSDTRELNVTKKWETENPLPESITVDLYRTVSGSDETPVLIGSEIMKPDEDGNWNLTLENLPEQDNSGRTYEYSVEEETSGAYISEIEGSMDDGFIITNRDRKNDGSLKLTKISSGHATPEDAVFTITGPDDYQKIIRYSELIDGSITLEGLAEGTYTVRESNAEVSGYTLTVAGSESAEVKNDSENPAEITLTNQYVPDGKKETHEEKTSGRLKLTKISSGHATPEDAVFTITGPDDYQKIIRYSELIDGSITLEGLAEGTYTVRESNAEVSGYTLTVAGSESAEVKNDSENPAEITLTNQYVPEGKKENPYTPSTRAESHDQHGSGSNSVSAYTPDTADAIHLTGYFLEFAGACAVVAATLRYLNRKS